MTRKNPRDAGANRKRPTDLELRVLVATARGSWMLAIAPGHGSRVYSQAFGRLKRMGLISHLGLVSESGTSTVTEARKEGRLK